VLLLLSTLTTKGGSVAECLVCWTRAQKELGSNRSRDAVSGKLFTPTGCLPRTGISSGTFEYGLPLPFLHWLHGDVLLSNSFSCVIQQSSLQGFFKLLSFFIIISINPWSYFHCAFVETVVYEVLVNSLTQLFESFSYTELLLQRLEGVLVDFLKSQYRLYFYFRSIWLSRNYR